jgi:hypothetical protein
MSTASTKQSARDNYSSATSTTEDDDNKVSEKAVDDSREPAVDVNQDGDAATSDKGERHQIPFQR